MGDSTLMGVTEGAKVCDGIKGGDSRIKVVIEEMRACDGSGGDSVKEILNRSSPWKKTSPSDVQPEVDIVNGVGSIQIPDEIFDES